MSVRPLKQNNHQQLSKDIGPFFHSLYSSGRTMESHESIKTFGTRISSKSLVK